MKIINLNQQWQFGDSQHANTWEDVNIPHDWNALGGSGIGTYEKCQKWYRKTLTLTPQEAEAYNAHSAYLQCGSGGMETLVYFNDAHVGSHQGGWSAFSVLLTGKFLPGENTIAIATQNTDNPDIAPLHGDFNRDTGLTRDISLILANPIHFERKRYGTAAVYIAPAHVPEKAHWQTNISTYITNDTAIPCDVTLKATIKHPTSFDHTYDAYFPVDTLRFDPHNMYDPTGATIGEAHTTATLAPGTHGAVNLVIDDIQNPNLWDGVNSPYQYIALVEIIRDGQVVDTYQTYIGFRHYKAVREADTYDKAGNGFYLNGRFYPLRGMGMHYDWPGIGRALTPEHIAADIGCLYQMGANWVRTSHYPHPPLTYELLGRYGIACSAEIPLIDGVGMTDGKKNGQLSENFRVLTLNQLNEMISQLYNHPAILGWLLQNELGGGTYGQGYVGDALAAQTQMVAALNAQAKIMDPYRPTIMAMSLPHCYQFDSDYLLWNNYPGWYSVTPDGIGTFVDKYQDHDTKTPKRPTGVSEYGAGINPFEHYDFSLQAEKPEGTGDPWHPEEYGNDRHEVSLREINARPFYWATAGWIMYDFSAAIRDEGGRAGINDKGLVRKERPQDVDTDGNPSALLFPKDVYYLYKANWNPAPLTYIASRRFNPRPQRDIVVTVYSNACTITLTHQGNTIGTGHKTERTDGTETGSCIFKFNLSLLDGENIVTAVGSDENGQVVSTDTVTWHLEEAVAEAVEAHGTQWEITHVPGSKIFVDNQAKLIYVPDDIPDFYPGGYMGGGMVFTGVRKNLQVTGHCRVEFSNDVDYSLMETSQLIITDGDGVETVYGFKFYQGVLKV